MVDFADNIWAFRAHDGLNRSHVPAHPLWLGFLRVAQLLIGFIVFVLTAYAAGQFHASGLAGFGLAWFTFIWTVGYFAYLAVSILFQPTIYHYLVHLGLEVLTVIWWLSTWAVLASEASAFTDFSLRFFPRGWRSAINCIKASAGLGALVWLLFLVSLAFLVLSILNHRKTEAGQAPVTTAPMTNIPPGGPTGQVPPQQPVYPQQTYQQAPAEGYPQGQYPPQQQYVGEQQQYVPPQQVPQGEAPPPQVQQTPYPQ